MRYFSPSASFIASLIYEDTSTTPPPPLWRLYKFYVLFSPSWPPFEPVPMVVLEI